MTVFGRALVLDSACCSVDSRLNAIEADLPDMKHGSLDVRRSDCYGKKSGVTIIGRG